MLDDLTAAGARDLALVGHPRAPWLTPRLRHGAPILDVLVVGAGQSGLATGFGLLRDRVDNILVVDRAAPGEEGPWATYARMPTLRSLKDQTGPDLGIPSLTYQAWHEAQWGAGHFAEMRWIPRGHWHDYLQWVRRVTGVPVRNGIAVTSIDPDRTDDGSACLRAGLSDGSALFARKVVLATGQDGTGRWWMPDFVAALPPHVRAHTHEAIDFPALRGRTVAVLGAGASAFDNAATALEAGAAAVHLFCRRAEPMIVQPYRWLTFAGFLKHMGDMPDEWRWRFMAYILGLREGFPPDTYARVNAHPNFTMHVGRPWTGAAATADGVRLDTPRGPFDAHYAICGTGVRHDFAQRPELMSCAGNIARWSDRYVPPESEADERLGQFPYLSPDYAFAERVPGQTPWIADIHLFGIGTSLSFGPAGSSINAMSTAVPKLVAGVTRGLFRGDLERNWAALRAYDIPQVVLDPARIAAE
ncbi:MAG: NAD(P)/FAD-dependent oxidoreductase [Gemmatimonadaceae bacterium]|nr:NAD(P)/FAD-dependent oxidoreductase [Acetobacteraceae bacterium]